MKMQSFVIYESFVKVAVNFFSSTSEMLLSKPIPVIRNSYPLLSDSSIRRLERQSIIPQRCRNQVTGLDGPMDGARLALRGQPRFPIGLSFLQHPKTGFRKVTGNRHLCAVVAAPGFNPLVKLADVFVATAFAILDRAASGFNKGPLQINIDIAAHRPVMKLSAAGALARYQATVARQLFGTVKPLNTADLGPDHHRQDLTDSRQALEPRSLRTGGKSFDHIGFDGFKILHHLVELVQNVIESFVGVGRKFARQFFDDLATTFSKSIADLVNDIAILTQGRVHAVLQLSSLSAKHHASARQLTGISNRTGRDPYRRQGACALQLVHSLGIEFVALVDVAHHQFCQTRVDQLRLSSPGFTFVHPPVPVAYRLHGHGRAGCPSVHEVLDAPSTMVQTNRTQLLAFRTLDSCPGVMLVNIQCNVFHNVSPPRSVLPSTAVTVCIAFIIIRLGGGIRTWIPASAGVTTGEPRCSIPDFHSLQASVSSVEALLTNGVKPEMIKNNFAIYFVGSLLWIAGVVMPDWAIGQKTTSVEKISFGIPAMDAGFLPLFVARDRNFFRDERIEPEIVQVKADIATKAIVTADLDFSAAAGSVVRAATAGMPLKVIL